MRSLISACFYISSCSFVVLFDRFTKCNSSKLELQLGHTRRGNMCIVQIILVPLSKEEDWGPRRIIRDEAICASCMPSCCFYQERENTSVKSHSFRYNSMQCICSCFSCSCMLFKGCEEVIKQPTVLLTDQLRQPVKGYPSDDYVDLMTEAGAA
jgi:hypothetical protein